MIQGYLAKKWGDKMFEKDMAKIVRKHAFWAGLIMMFPTLGLGLIIYCVILWNMYSALCKKCNTKLQVSTVIVGFVVNLIVTIIINAVLAWIPVLGWLGTGFVVYLQFYMSGKAYIETLKELKM